MSKLKKYEDIQKMAEAVNTYLPEEDKTEAILLLNELAALRNGSEVSNAAKVLKHVKGRISTASGERIRAVAIYDASVTEDEDAIDEMYDGNIMSKDTIIVRADSVGGKFYLPKKAKTEAPVAPPPVEEPETTEEEY